MLKTIPLTLLFFVQSLSTQAFSQPENPALDVFYEMQTTRCDIHASKEEKWQLLRLRLNRQFSGVPCSLTKQQTTILLTDVLAANQKVNGQQAYNSMLIGHIADYMWLQRHLTEGARQDSNWASEKTKPENNIVNSYVNRQLGSPDIMATFNLVAEKFGYHFSGMDCEKVFISEDGLPYDAFCWLKIKQN